MKINIKEEIAKKLKKRVDESDEFKNIEEYVNYILNQVVERLKKENKEKEVYSEEDEKKVKERLKSLGYLD